MRSAASILASLFLVCAASPSMAQQWALEMFDHTTHDFGTVARGSEADHRFVVENIYEEDAQIVSVRSSCGCTKLEYPKQVLKTWEKGEIIATLDTRGYFGKKDATITVVFNQPYHAEVQLHVHTNIRRDVVVQPGSVRFGSVAQGTAYRQKVNVDYAGRADWKIVKVECANPHLQAEVTPLQATAGQVSYQLAVTLSNKAPVGYIRGQVVLVTNDANPAAARIPVAVEATVSPPVTIRPSPLSGEVGVGETITRRLVVQAKKPFKILKVGCDDPRFKCTVVPKSETLYLIRVSFTAGANSEEVREKILIETDFAGGQVFEAPVQIHVGR